MSDHTIELNGIHYQLPSRPVANQFYRDLDDRFGRLAELGALVALTADHGMNDKANAVGEPNVIFLQDILDRDLGMWATTVICPITDAFVGHHGALGGFVRVYCHQGHRAEEVLEIVSDMSGVAQVWSAEAVARDLQQPLDREGDVAVMGDAHTVIGGRESEHDLSALKGSRLRTHGSLFEADVPFILSEPLNGKYAKRGAAGGLRSRELFEFALNGVA